MSNSLVSSSLCRYTDVYRVCSAVYIQFFVNSFSTPSSFIHKWFREEQKIHRTSRSIVSNLLYRIQHVLVSIVFSLFFVIQNNFKIQSHMGFFPLSTFTHTRQTTYGGVQTMTSNNRSNWYKLTFYSYFNQYDSFHVMNILDGDAVWEIDIERTTQLKKRQHTLASIHFLRKNEFEIIFRYCCCFLNRRFAIFFSLFPFSFMVFGRESVSIFHCRRYQ